MSGRITSRDWYLFAIEYGSPDQDELNLISIGSEYSGYIFFFYNKGIVTHILSISDIHSHYAKVSMNLRLWLSI